MRTGWTIPGRFREMVIRMKLNTLLSTPSINHRVVSRFLETGAYDRHLRKLRHQIKNQASAIAVAKHFPSDTQITFPKGGMLIWIVLNKKKEKYQNVRKQKPIRMGFIHGGLPSR